MTQFWSPLVRLIEQRRKELGLRKGELASRCGCINPAKGIPWIDAIARGQIDHARAQEIMKALPAALDIDQEEFNQALALTLKQNEEREQKEEAERIAAWRASFRPHAYLTTESQQPSQIVIMALTGGPDRWLRINLDLDQSPLTFVGQARKVANKTKGVPFFGRVTGFVVNYSPDEAVRFDLEANPLTVFDRAYSPGQASIMHRGREIDGPQYARIIGLTEARGSPTA
jgi:transcriptional regulator with XRE-family HTH domain